MKYVVYWIEMLKRSSVQLGSTRNWDRYASIQSFCSYRLKQAIRNMRDEAFFYGHESGKRFAKAELNDWPPKEAQK